MRAFLLATTFLVSSVAATPAWSQSWSGALPNMPGGSAVLSFEVPAISDLISWDFWMAYSPSVFETPDIVTLGTGAMITINPSGAPDPSHFPVPLPAGFEEASVSVIAADPHAGGALLTVGMKVLGAPQLGPTSVFTSFKYGTELDEEFTVNVAALNVTVVPEPSTWVTMLAGLGLIGLLAARRRSTVSGAGI